MTQRTEQEKLRIIDKCLNIEADGGDVLAYLASEHYVSPRATWINIQKNDLHRCPTEITNGRPTGKKQKRGSMPKKVETKLAVASDAEAKGKKNMPKREGNRVYKKHSDIKSVYEEYKRMVIDGGDIKKLLIENQYRNVVEASNFYRRKMKEEGYRFDGRGRYIGPPETPEDHQPLAETPEGPAGFHPEIVNIIKDELEEKRPESVAETPEQVAGPYKVVLLRPIREKLNQMFLDLISKAYNARGSDMEVIQEELYMCLMQIMSLRETTNLARAQAREVVQ